VVSETVTPAQDIGVLSWIVLALPDVLDRAQQPRFDRIFLVFENQPQLSLNYILSSRQKAFRYFIVVVTVLFIKLKTTTII